ncbi:phage tail protein [Enterococcus casseliflavus]|uniref:phage tail protein n=2 Tax=Enterococcus casseliflavus TaxID=37734 RepID=UPI0018A89711|nr:phage tail protein [Enterococcus casseliflavus]
MIIFFFDRFWNPLGKASAKLPKGVTYYDDHEVEDVETGTSTFEVYVGFDEENRNIVRAYGQEATYFVTTDQEGHGRLWSVIDDESDEEAMFHYFYGEDAGMDLINEMLPAWGSPGSAKPIVYYIERAAADSGFEIGINEIPNLTRTLEWDGEATGLNRLQSIFTQFDNAELQFRFDIDENTLELKHKYIDILKKRGNDRGIELRMNREVKNIRMKRSRANMFNAYRCYGATPEGKENPITLNGYSLTTAQKEINPETGKARFVLSGNILKDTESNAKYSRYLNPYEQGEDEGYYTGIYNSEATTQNALANETILQLKKTGYPEVNYEVDVIDAPRTLKAGDYVSIVNDKDELYLEGRILKTDRSRSNDTFEITLGDYLIRDSGIAEQIQAMADKLKGKDGVSNFIFYAYADDDKGTGFSLNPQGKKYTGLTVSLVNQQPSDPSVYTWSLSKGSDGRGILGSPISTFAKSKDGTIPPTTWSSTRPNVEPGEYLWTRIVTTYTDNTTSETQTPTLMGADGPSGLGIRDKSISYAVGSSGNTPPSSGWQATIPIVSANQYLWTRTTIVYTDDSKTDAYSVGKMGADGANAKLLYLTASAENMAFNADDTPKTTQTINISAKLQNVTGTATFTAIPYIGNTAQTAITLGGTGNTRTLTSAQWTNKNWTLIAITATLDNLSDTLSIVKVKDGATGDKGDQGNQGIPGTPGADGKTPYTHWAYAWSADGKDRFTSSYPIENILIGTTSDTQTLTTNSGWPDKTGATNALMAVGADRLVKAGDTITYSAFITAPADVRAYIYVRLNRPGASNGSYEDKTSNRLDPGTSGWCSVTVTVPSDTTSLRFTVGRYENSNAVTRTLSWASEKAEKSDKRTIYTPSPADDFANAYPTYVGTYTDYEPTDSEDPSKYTWQRILGESGQDGKDGEDGANGQDAKEVISGYLSNDSIIVPANASGTVTDFTKALGDFIIYEGQTKVSSGVTYSKVSEIGMTSTINSAGRYTVTALSADVGTVTYQAMYKAVTIQKIMIVVKNKQGGTGPAGTNGTDGKGIVSSATTYQAGTSGTTPPTGTWSTSIPSVSENQYLWTKIVLTYSDNTNSTAYSVGKMGAKGETGSTGSTGATGATGNGIKSTTINFASSTSGTTAPSSGWTSSIPMVAAGSFLWTRTVLTFTDNTTNTSYTVAKQGEKGDPTGIISQATVPTNPYVGMLWQNTGASGYIIGATYQWNGSKFNLYIFTADNIVATTLSAITANLGTITAGTINGVTINSSEFVNPYTRQYNDGTFAQGTQRIGSAELYNSGVIKNSQGVITQSYETIFSHQFVSMARYSGSATGDQNELIASASLSFDTLTLNDRENGFSGMIHARQLTDTPWINLSYAAGFRTSENNPCQYQISYNMKGKRTITFRGQVERTSGAMTGTTYPFGIGTVPASIRPTGNTFKLAAGDATELQTVRVAMLGTAQPSIGNSIQIKVVGNSQYVDISALTYDIP